MATKLQKTILQELSKFHSLTEKSLKDKLNRKTTLIPILRRLIENDLISRMKTKEWFDMKGHRIYLYSITNKGKKILRDPIQKTKNVKTKKPIINKSTELYNEIIKRKRSLDKLNDIVDLLSTDKKIIQQAKANTLEDFRYSFDREYTKEIIDIRNEPTLLRNYFNDKEFRELILKRMSKIAYYKYRKIKGKIEKVTKKETSIYKDNWDYTRFTEPTYYHPFSNSQMVYLNQLTHFPSDHNIRFEESIKGYEREIKEFNRKYGFDETPEEIKIAFDKLYKGLKESKLERARARTIAPPVSVVGGSGWKNPKRKFAKADGVRMRSAEKITKIENQFYLSMKRVRKGLVSIKRKEEMKSLFPSVFSKRRVEFGKNYGEKKAKRNPHLKSFVDTFRKEGRNLHRKIVKFALETNVKVPNEIMLDYPKLAAQYKISVKKISPKIDKSKVLKKDVNTYAINISKEIKVLIKALRDIGILNSTTEYHLESLNDTYRKMIKNRLNNPGDYNEPFTWREIESFSSKTLKRAYEMKDQLIKFKKKEFDLQLALDTFPFRINTGYISKTNKPIWRLYIKERIDPSDFKELKRDFNETNIGYYNYRPPSFVILKEDYSDLFVIMDKLKDIVKRYNLKYSEPKYYANILLKRH